MESTFPILFSFLQEKYVYTDALLRVASSVYKDDPPVNAKERRLVGMWSGALIKAVFERI